jgi:poly(3-hydroxybutyrate) depolymerase
VSLIGWPFLVLLIAVAVVVLAGVWLTWARWPRRLALPGRLLGLVLVMVMGAAIGGDLLNRAFDFYSSFSDLLGNPPSAQAFAVLDAPKAAAKVQFADPNWLTGALANAGHGHGSLLKVTLPGTRSGIVRDGQLYLPAAYFRGSRDRFFAAIEIFHGYPGHPHDFERGLGLAAMLDNEIAAGRIPPVVAVIPRTYDHASTECVDGIDGERDETYLTQDVYDDIVTSLRVQAGRTWAALGVSTGGFCAVNLALHHPERYAAAASLSGYFSAGEDPGTGRLYGGRGKFSRDVNSPLWWVEHRAPTAPPLFLFASAGDPPAVHAAAGMAAALRNHAKGLPMDYELLPSGGHNWGVWSVAFAPAVDWIAQYLPAPLAPAKSLPDGPYTGPRAERGWVS